MTTYENVCGISDPTCDLVPNQRELHWTSMLRPSFAHHRLLGNLWDLSKCRSSVSPKHAMIIKLTIDMQRRNTRSVKRIELFRCTCGFNSRMLTSSAKSVGSGVRRQSTIVPEGGVFSYTSGNQCSSQRFKWLTHWIRNPLPRTSSC